MKPARWVIGVYVTTSAVAGSTAFAQFEPTNRPRDLILGFLDGRDTAEDLPQVTLEPNPEVEALFARARDAASRQDYKLAVDCFQRIIESPQSGLVDVDSDAASAPTDRMKLAESARACALRQLGALPAPAREAYELLYGPIGRRLVESGVNESDAAKLERVTADYPYTSAAVEAFDRLVALRLDEGRAIEAMALLDDAATYRPQMANRPRTRVQRMVALLMLGREREAADLLNAGDVAGLSPQLNSANLSRLRAGFASTEMGHGRVPTPSQAYFPPTGAFPDFAADVEHAPVWRFLLSGANARAWSYVLMARKAWEVPLPLASNFVVDGRRLYVRTSEGCAALDAAGLSPQWVWRSPAPPTMTAPEGLDDAASLMLTWVTRATSDYIGGSISTAHDRVFLIERRRTWDPVVSTMFRWQFGVDSHDTHDSLLTDLLGGDPTRLVALDANSGEEAWSLDATSSNSPLAQARFIGPPLSVGETVWAPLAQGHDVACVVLDPKDGRLIDRVHLCSVSSLGEPRGRALYLATDGRRVIAQTGHGLLVCINASDRSLLWASRYNDGDYTVWQHRTDQLQGRMGWLPSPPVVVGDVVLNAPVEFNALIAHDARTGDAIWRVPVLDHQYVIAADADSAWLGGASVSRLSMSDGHTLWSRPLRSFFDESEGEVDPPTGRAVLCGDRIVVPHLRGLIAISAESGDRVDEHALLERPVGEVVSLGESLISVDPDEVRQFTDVEQSAGQARSRLAQDPADVDAIVRLAWLEWLSGDVASAWARIESLDAISGGGSPSRSIPRPADQGMEASRDDNRVERVRKLRFSCLLGLSQQADSAARRLELAAQAQETAGAPDERREAGLELAEAQRTAGQALLAFQTAWKAMSGSDPAGPSDRPGATDSSSAERMAFADLCARLDDGIRQQGRIWANQRVADLATRSERLTQVMCDPAASPSQLEAASNERPALLTQLDRVARLRLRGAGSAGACLALGRVACSEQRFEAAEQAFLAARHLDESPSATVEAMASLAQLYNAELDQPALCREMLGELSRRFASTLLPDGVASPVTSPARDAPSTATRNSDAGEAAHDARPPTTVREWVDQKTLEWRPHLAQTPDPRKPLRVVRESEANVLGASDDVRALHTGSRGADPLWNEVVLLADGRRLISRHIDNGSASWSTDLRLSGRFRSEFSEEQEPSAFLTWDAGVSGATLIAINREGIHAVGAQSGKRLWTCPFDLPPLGTTNPGQHTWRIVSTGMEGVASLRSWSTVAMLDAMDGSPLWESDVPDVLIAVHQTPTLVLAASHDFGRIHMFDAATGARVGQAAFAPTTSLEQAPDVLVFPEVLVGRDATTPQSGVVAFHPGEAKPAWTLNRPDVQRLVTAAADKLLVSLEDHRIMLIDAADGRAAFESSFPGATVKDAWSMDGVLIVQHDPRPESPEYCVLTALDMNDGHVLWTKPGVIMTSIPQAVWQAFGGTLPLLTEVEDPRRRQYNPVVLTTIDARTGQALGAPLVLLPKDSRERPTGDMEMRPGKLLVSTSAGIRVFELDTTTAGAGTKP